MTAVVRFNLRNRIPVIVGDLLISKPSSAPPVSMRLPTFDDTANLFLTPPNYFPCGIQQKIAVIGDVLAVAWAGNYQLAKDAITTWYHAYRNGDLSIGYLTHYLKSLGVGEPSFVGFLCEGNGYHQFGHHYEHLDTDEFGNVGFLGTGADSIHNLLKQVVDLPSFKAFDLASKSPTLGDQAAAVSLALTGNLLMTELVTGSTLYDAYGGGYEIAQLVPSGFRKLCGITYAFWRARVLSDQEVRVSQIPFHVCAYGYTGDVLSVRTLSSHASTNGGVSKHWYDHIAPIYRDMSNDEREAIGIPDFNSKWLCNYFLVDGLNGTQVLTRIECRATGRQTCLHFQDLPNGTGIAVEQAFIESVARDILEKYGKPSPQ